MTNPNFDLGPLEAILQDSEVTEIMVNGPYQIYIEKHGELIETDAKFDSEEHLLKIVDTVLRPMGRQLDESNPIVDARLPDGSRVNVVGAPISLTGTTMTIRKFSKRMLNAEDLIRFGSWNKQIVTFLKTCVQARMNMAVAGGTGSGKTTVANILCSFIGPEERIIVAEHAAELQLHQKHVVRMETRPPNLEGRGRVSMQDLLQNAMKMRPERIIAGEVHGGEVIDIFAAMNTGHDGAMLTIHANNPADVVARLEVMATMAGLNVPLLTIREQMAAAIDLITVQQRLPDGKRKILYITEVMGLKGGIIETQDLFVFHQTGIENGEITGYHSPTGAIPRFLDRLSNVNPQITRDFFTPVNA